MSRLSVNENLYWTPGEAVTNGESKIFSLLLSDFFVMINHNIIDVFSVVVAGKDSRDWTTPQVHRFKCLPPTFYLAYHLSLPLPFTPIITAPECTKGYIHQKLCFTSSMWNLGGFIYELLTGMVRLHVIVSEVWRQHTILLCEKRQKRWRGVEMGRDERRK